MSVLVSPAEPAMMKVLGKTHSGVEDCGVDVLWPAFGGLVGVQRKEVSDLFSSIDDGRLNSELAKARSRLKATWLLIEGVLLWGRDGKLGGKLGDYHRRWSQDGFWAFLTGVQASGVWVGWTNDVAQSVVWVERMVQWSQKKHHNSLLTRPTPQGRWGTATSKEWMVHLLAGFPKVSVGRALAILEKYPQPLAWTMTREELMTVPGIGPKLATSLTEALTGAMVPPPARSSSANGEDRIGVGGASPPSTPQPARPPHRTGEGEK